MFGTASNADGGGRGRFGCAVGAVEFLRDVTVKGFPALAKQIAVKFLADETPFGIRQVHSVRGINSVQVAHVTSRLDDAEREQAIVNPYPLKPNTAECLAIAEEIQRVYPTALVSVFRDDGQGCAAAFAMPDAAKLSACIAAAVATVKAAWGRDESSTFEISVNDQAVSLRAVMPDGGEWFRWEA